MSSYRTGGILIGRSVLAVIGLLAALPAFSQYPGQVTKTGKDTPELRAIAVLEWVGEAGKPARSRLVPIAVLDGGKLEDGGIYMARPEPLSLSGEVEYELEQGGKPIGLYDVRNAGQEQGSWVGYGTWRPMPVARPRQSQQNLARTHVDDDVQGDEPVLHRKRHGDDGRGGSGSGGGTGSSSGASSGSSSGAPAQDDDPVSDPDRPTLKRGRSSGPALDVVPSLVGLPPDVEQAVAVSDAKTHPVHPWAYSWSSPDDEAKMKSAMEDIVRNALGLTPPVPKPAPKRATTTATRRTAKPVPPPPAPIPLSGEQFRVFELAYGSGATLVLSAHTDGPAAQQKFVTLVAQPDLYGNVLVLMKNVTDGAHLDEKPRMKLVDAVDAMADNRGELLIELRGATQRQFALYRVLRGQAEKLFVSGGADFGVDGKD